MRKSGQNYQQCSLFQGTEGDVHLSLPLDRSSSLRVVSKVILGTGRYNHYRITIFRPATYRTPYPDNLDYYVEREVRFLSNGYSHRTWKYLTESRLAGVTSKVFWVASRLMADAAGIPIESRTINFDGVPVAEEFIPLCSKIRTIGGIQAWRDALVSALCSYKDLQKLFVLESGAKFKSTCFEKAYHILELCGFSEIECVFLLASYSYLNGINPKRSLFARYLKAAQPTRSNILQAVHPALLGRDEVGYAIEGTMEAILGELTSTFFVQIERRDKTLRWTLLSPENSDPEDLSWELEHGRLLPLDLLSRFPDLVMRFGI